MKRRRGVCCSGEKALARSDVQSRHTSGQGILAKTGGTAKS